MAPTSQVGFVGPDGMQIRWDISAGGGFDSEPLVAPGRYDFFPTHALKLKLHISNDNDDPYTPKAIALLFKETRHFRLSGRDTDIYVHGKMIETMFDQAEDVTLSGLSFDYHRPTVSEFTVLAVHADQAEVFTLFKCINRVFDTV